MRLIPPSSGTGNKKHVASVFRWGIVLLLAVGGILVLRSTDFIQAWMENLDEARAWMMQYGRFKASLMFLFFNTVLCAFGFPRLWSSAFAGMLFGGPLAICLSFPSSVMGAGLTFTFIRKMGSKKFAAKVLSRCRGTNSVLTTPGFIELVLIRQLPLPGIVSTLLLAFTNVSLAMFLASAAVGFMPGAVIACLTGDVTTIEHSKWQLVLITVIVLVALVVLSVMRRKASRVSKVAGNSDHSGVS